MTTLEAESLEPKDQTYISNTIEITSTELFGGPYKINQGYNYNYGNDRGISRPIYSRLFGKYKDNLYSHKYNQTAESVEKKRETDDKYLRNYIDRNKLEGFTPDRDPKDPATTETTPTVRSRIFSNSFASNRRGPKPDSRGGQPYIYRRNTFCSQIIPGNGKSCRIRCSKG